MRLVVANLSLAAFMAGVIWLVQLVVYPMFLDAGAGAFPAWEDEHARRISPLVGPVMLGQLGVATALVLTTTGTIRLLAAGNLGLLLVALVATGLISVPLHDELTRGFSAATVDRLVATNWIRTAAWSAQLAVAVLLALRAGD